MKKTQALLADGREIVYFDEPGSATLKYLAGSESAMGVFVNDVRPEAAAELLRETC
jgi:UDPglucose--hexose-1-phosphate uridylyltransferase